MLPTLYSYMTPSYKGVVVARVIDATNIGLPINQLTIIPQNLNESEKIKPSRLEALQPRMNGTTVFASLATPGNYSLSSIRAFHSNGNGWYSYFARADSSFGTFEVKPGKITDLGSIIYYRKPQGDRYVDTLVRIGESDMGEVLRQYFPKFATGDYDILTWKEDGLDEDRHSQLISIAQNPTVYSTRYRAPDGSVYFLAKLGVILCLQANGEWQMDAVDTNLGLSAIAVNQSGAIAVGGSEGALFYKKAGDEWLNASLDKKYDIEKLQFTAQGDLDVIARAHFKLSIFRSSTETGSLNWQELNSYDSAIGWRKMSNQSEQNKSSVKTKSRLDRVSGVALREQNATHYITVFSHSDQLDPVFANSDYTVFEYDPNTWEVHTTDNPPPMTITLEAGTALLGIKKPGFWSWSNSPAFYRYASDTDSWEEISTSIKSCDGSFRPDENCTVRGSRMKRRGFSFISLPWFKNDNDALAVVKILNYEQLHTDKLAEINFVKTTNGGKSWWITDIKFPRDHCVSIVPEILDRLVVSCNGVSGDFFASTDGGKHWQQIRQHEDF